MEIFAVIKQDGEVVEVRGPMTDYQMNRVPDGSSELCPDCISTSPVPAELNYWWAY